MIALRQSPRMLDQTAVEAAGTRQACAAELPAPVEQQRYLADELAKAARYVRALLPEPQTGLIDADWVYQPSVELGGDAFGYHWLDDEHFAVYLLDASGHGFGAALHSVSVLNVLRAQTLPTTDFHQAAEVLAALNEAFQMKKYHNMYFTMVRCLQPEDPVPDLRHRRPPPRPARDRRCRHAARRAAPDARAVDRRRARCRLSQRLGRRS